MRAPLRHRLDVAGTRRHAARQVIVISRVKPALARALTRALARLLPRLLCLRRPLMQRLRVRLAYTLSRQQALKRRVEGFYVVVRPAFIEAVVGVKYGSIL